jgi:putative transposase
MPLLAYCLPSNHFHLVVRPIADSDLSQWMHWLMTTHVRRYLKYYGPSGHIWQGRFKAIATQDDEHLIMVVHYVERNPLRAGLVRRAEDWPWSSLASPEAQAGARIESGPRITDEEILHSGNWPEFVNAPMTEAECEAIRQSIRRDRPYGSEFWTRSTAARLGLLSSLRSRGDQGAVDPEITQNP